MSFDQAWILLFAVAPIGWSFHQWGGTARKGALVLKTLAFLAIILALAQPRITYFDSKVAVAILADTSRSVSPQDLERASSIVTSIERARGRHRTEVIPFARSARKAAPQERGKSWRLQYTAGDGGHGTDIEAAVREAIGTLPAGMVHRVVLISDGNENLGSSARAAWQAQQLGIPIDTFALSGSTPPDLRVESVSLPSLVFSGERFPIDITVSAPRRAAARVEITAEGRRLGLSDVALEPGVNHLRVRASVTAVGAVALAGKIGGAGLGEARFDQAVTIRQPRALLISRDPPATQAHLQQTLESSRFEVQLAQEVPDKF